METVWLDKGKINRNTVIFWTLTFHFHSPVSEQISIPGKEEELTSLFCEKYSPTKSFCATYLSFLLTLKGDVCCGP